jgi:hypothetical protein
MKEFWNSIQFAFAAIGGWLGWFLGGCDGLLIALIIFAVTTTSPVSCAPSSTRSCPRKSASRASAARC